MSTPEPTPAKPAQPAPAPIIVYAAHEHGDRAHQGEWRNHKGHYVKPGNVSRYDQDKENLVIPMVQQAARLSLALAEFKRASFAAWYEFQEAALREYGVEVATEKGNGHLVSFNQRWKVEMKCSPLLEFDTRIKAAQENIRQCMAEWGKDAHPHMAALFDDAFEVDGKGMISPRKIMQFLRHDIDDDRWREAKRAASEALYVSDRAAYLSFYERVEEAPGRWVWRGIPLSLAAA